LADTATRTQATGKRKRAVASVYIIPGKGVMTVNNRPADEYFRGTNYYVRMLEPLKATNNEGRFDIKATVRGGGISGQAGALRHGVAKALLKYDENMRQQLKQMGFLTRDPRMKERKKYGQRGARARFQFSKR
jgi:small subunit ribosomal protein S9